MGNSAFFDPQDPGGSVPSGCSHPLTLKLEKVWFGQPSLILPISVGKPILFPADLYPKTGHRDSEVPGQGPAAFGFQGIWDRELRRAFSAMSLEGIELLVPEEQACPSASS